jgi:hypothetical protein
MSFKRAFRSREVAIPHRNLRATAVAMCLVVAPLTAALAGCSDNGSNSTKGNAATTTTTTNEGKGRRITQDEASLLADMLVKNNEVKGAAFTATVPYGVATFTLNGEIDWEHSVAGAVVRTAITDKPSPAPFQVLFNHKIVFEQLDGLAAALEARNQPPANWVVRALDPEKSPLDVVLKLILSTSSIQRDNPVLLMSNGTKWLRNETIGGQKTAVYQYGTSQYWVTEDGVLVKLAATLKSTGSIATVEFSDRKARTIATPEQTDVVELSAVADLYQQLRG